MSFTRDIVEYLFARHQIGKELNARKLPRSVNCLHVTVLSIELDQRRGSMSFDETRAGPVRCLS